MQKAQLPPAEPSDESLFRYQVLSQIFVRERNGQARSKAVAVLEHLTADNKLRKVFASLPDYKPLKNTGTSWLFFQQFPFLNKMPKRRASRPPSNLSKSELIRIAAALDRHARFPYISTETVVLLNLNFLKAMQEFYGNLIFNRCFAC